MSGAECAGTRPSAGESCRHCGDPAAVLVEMGPVSFGLCREHAPDGMLEGQR